MIWSVKSQSKLFYELEESMQGTDYVPFISAWSFETNSAQFTFDDLETINNEPWADGKIRPVIGDLTLDNFQSATSTINEYLSYIKAEVYPRSLIEEKTVAARLDIFWGIIKNFILIDSVTPITYQHFPATHTRFFRGYLWDCVYIFIAGNKGFLVAMGAYD